MPCHFVDRVPARHKIVSAGEHVKLGSFLRVARESAGVSQRELALRLNLPQSYVSKIERGERQLQVLEFIEVCRKIGIEPHTFLRNYLSTPQETETVRSRSED